MIQWWFWQRNKTKKKIEIATPLYGWVLFYFILFVVDIVERLTSIMLSLSSMTDGIGYGFFFAQNQNNNVEVTNIWQFVWWLTLF